MSDVKINLQYTTLTTPLPNFIYEGLQAFSQNANGYRPQPVELLKKLAEKYSVSQDMIFLTAGADEAIQMFALAFGKKSYFFTPTYIVYKDTADFYANITALNALKDYNYVIPTDSLPDATLIYLANPNNPFAYTSKEKVLELVRNNSNAVVVIDEVYAEFTDLSVIEEIKNYSRLVVLRSFSKSYGMAGNRIGFIVAHPDIITKVRTKTQWSNVSYLSVGAAITALHHEEYFKSLTTDIVTRREAFTLFLKKKGYTVLPSRINAVLIKFLTDDKGTQFAQYLMENNFIISHGNGNSNIGLDNSFVRISIGNQNEMRTLQEVIDKFEV